MCVQHRLCLSLSPHNMSGCAVDNDCNLLDADKIEWFNDPDDLKPINVTPSHSSAKATVAATLDSFFSRSGSPAFKIASARRSQRVPWLSAKAAELSDRPGLKRKATDNHHQCLSTRRRVTSFASDTSNMYCSCLILRGSVLCMLKELVVYGSVPGLDAPEPEPDLKNRFCSGPVQGSTILMNQTTSPVPGS